MTSVRSNLVPAWRWALKQTWRDVRSGTLNLLLVAVVLAVAALSAVAFLADRIEKGLNRDAAQLLGADLVVVADQPVPADLKQSARAQGLQTTDTAAMASMARAPDQAGGQSKLVALKAVGDAYPLRGHVTLRAQGEQTVTAPPGGPPAGSVWVDPAVLTGLNLRVGDNLMLGEAGLKIAAVIATEPDRGAGFMGFSPRVMMRLSDLPSTQLVQPASRITYRLLVAGAAVQRFQPVAQQASRQVRGLHIETLEQGRPEMRATLDRAGLFLRLVGLLAALLSAVAVALVSRDFAQQRLDECAVLRVMGVTQRRMAASFAVQFLLIGLIGSVIGLLLGWLGHGVFIGLLGDLIPVTLPAPGWMPLALGLGVGVLLVCGFGLPPVLQLAQVPPLRVLRRDLGELKAASLSAWAAGCAALVGLLLTVARDIKLGGIALGGFGVALLVFAACTYVIVSGLRWLLSRHGQGLPSWLVLAIRQLAAQPGTTIVQVSSLAVGLLALILLVLLRTDLIASWRAATPPDAPDRFVINIQPDQAEAFQQQLQAQGVKHYDWFPMVRARLVSINGREVRAEQFPDERAQRLVEREFNLSHAGEAPSYNPVVAGRFVPEEPDAWSVEEGLAKTLGLKLGDRLSFDLAGTAITGRITSLRKVDWSSMRVNFFVLAPHKTMPDWPVTYITAFKAPSADLLDRQLVQRFPNITLIDVSSTLAQIHAIVSQVIAAVEFLFVFTLAAGVLVLSAGLWTSRERRAKDWAVMRALGASGSLLGKVQRVELISVGALAGGLAAAAALLIGWVLASRVFEFTWHAPLWWLLVGAAAGAVVTALVGRLSLRGVMQRPVVMTLRRAD